MEENKKREEIEEVETLDLGVSSSDNKKLNESLEGTTPENVKETILENDLNSGIKNESLEENILSNDNAVDNVFGEEFVGLNNLDDNTSEPLKPKKKKGVLIVVVIVVLLLAAALGYLWYSRNDSNDELKDVMKTAALDYYDKYGSVNTGASAYTVTLDDLKNANENGESYNLDSLKDCDGDKTEVIINIDYSNGKAKDTEVRLSCKIF